MNKSENSTYLLMYSYNLDSPREDLIQPFHNLCLQQVIIDIPSSETNYREAFREALVYAITYLRTKSLHCTIGSLHGKKRDILGADGQIYGDISISVRQLHHLAGTTYMPGHLVHEDANNTATTSVESMRGEKYRIEYQYQIFEHPYGINWLIPHYLNVLCKPIECYGEGYTSDQADLLAYMSRGAAIYMRSHLEMIYGNPNSADVSYTDQGLVQLKQGGILIAEIHIQANRI